MCRIGLYRQLPSGQGLAENDRITKKQPSEKFQEGLDYVTRELAKMMARDGEGSNHMIEVLVEGAGYDIRVRFLSSFTSGERGTILDAVGTWEAVVTGDLSPAFPSQGGDCDEGGRGIDDLLVSVRAVSIDGPGNTLARAGPCLLRSSNRLPIAVFSSPALLWNERIALRLNVVIFLL